MGMIKIVDNRNEKFGNHIYDTVYDAQAAIDEIVEVCKKNNIPYDYDVADIPTAGMTYNDYQDYLSGKLKFPNDKQKLDNANNNIIELIDTVISYEESDIRTNCPKPHSYGKFECPKDNEGNKVSCGECKEIYIEQLRERMIKKYIVEQ